MVNFNPAEIRGFHGRWILGGARHAHLRHLLGGRRRGASSPASSTGKITHEEVAAARAAVAARREAARVAALQVSGATPFGSWAANAGGTRREIRGVKRKLKSAEQTAAEEARASNTADRQAARAMREARAERESTSPAARKAARNRSNRHRLRGAYWAYQRHNQRGGGLGGHGMLGYYLFRHHRKTSTGPKKISVGKVPVAKKGPAAKKPAAKKMAKAAAAKQPRVIPTPKAPVGKAGTGKGGKGSAQVVKPSAQVMANLAGYVNAPGGKRAGIGTAGRTSMSSTGRTAGSRVGGAGSSRSRPRR